MARMVTCQACRGSGEVTDPLLYAPEDCAACDGSGKIRDPSDTEPSEAQLQRMTEEPDDTAVRAALRDAGRRDTL